MKSIQEIVAARAATPDEQETLAAVLEIAREWEAGRLPLPGVRSACSGYMRWVAMRFAGVHNPDKALLLRLADAIFDDLGDVQTNAGPLTRQDLATHEALLGTDAHGHRVVRFATWSEERGRHYRPIPDHKLAEGDRYANDRD